MCTTCGTLPEQKPRRQPNQTSAPLCEAHERHLAAINWWRALWDAHLECVCCSDFHHFHIVASAQRAHCGRFLSVVAFIWINLDVCVNLLVSVTIEHSALCVSAHMAARRLALLFWRWVRKLWLRCCGCGDDLKMVTSKCVCGC